MPDDKLHELTTEGNFRDKVGAVLGAVGYKMPKRNQPYIASADRSPAQQMGKIAAGFSKLKRSKHVGVNFKDKKARAADIVPEVLLWNNAPKRYWLLLGSAAWAMGLGWGGLFGFSRAQRNAVRKAIVELRSLGWPLEHPLYESTRISWDPAHVELGSNW